MEGRLNNMKYVKIIIVSLTILLLTGCWNYHELEDLAIVGGIGIDREADVFNISVEVLNAKKVASNTGSGGGGGSEETPSVVYEAKGKTIREALNNIVLESPVKLYIGHMNLLVIGEETAKDGIYEVLDFFMRDFESRKRFPTFIVQDAKASDVLKIIKPLDTVISSNIQTSAENTAAINGVISNRLFDEILMCLYQVGRHPTISAIKIIKPSKVGESNDNLSSSEPETTIKIIGSAVFKNDKLVGYLNEKESIGYTIIRDTAQSITVSFPCDDKGNYGNLAIDSVKNNLEVNVEKGKPIAKINVTGNAALVEYNCKTDLKNEKNIKEMKKIADKELEKIIEKTITTTQKEFRSDILGFGERLYKDNNSYWEKHKKNWDDTFSKMDYKIKTDIKIERIGSTTISAKSR